MNDSFFLLLSLLVIVIFFSLPLVFVFLILIASQKNWNAMPQKEQVVSFVGFWKRISLWLVNAALSFLIIPIFFNVYYYFRDGQTIGDKLYGTKIVDKKTMKTASVGKLIMRHFAKILSSICLGIGFIAAGVRTEKRAWHDEWAEVRYISYKQVSWIWTFLPLFLVFILPFLIDILRGYFQ